MYDYCVFFCYLCNVCVPSVLWYCWLGLLTCKNRRPYNLYCFGGDVKPCSINQTTARHYTIDHRPQLTWQWNKCVKHSLEWDSSLPVTYPRLDNGYHLTCTVTSWRWNFQLTDIFNLTVRCLTFRLTKANNIFEVLQQLMYSISVCFLIVIKLVNCS